MTNEAKDCPCCGSAAKIDETYRKLNRPYTVDCTNDACGLSSGMSREALGRWNRRVGE